MRRRTVLAAQAVALTALVGGTSAFVVLDKTVTLSVDGEARQVHSFAGTVGGVLEDEGIAIGPHDVVAPGLSSPVDEGDRVSVEFGRPLRLNVDGKTRELWTTEDTVAEALQQLGMRAEGAFVSVSRSRDIGRDGLSLELRTPKKMTFVVAGKKVPVTTTAPTVGKALADADLKLGRLDRLSVAASTPVKEGARVELTRIRTRTVVENRDIAYGTVTRESDDLYEGESSVQRSGREGVREVTIRETLTDGAVTKRRVLGSTLTRKRQDRIVLEGTKERPQPAPSSSSSSSGTSSSSGSSSSGSSSSASGSSGSSSSGGSRSSSSSSESPSTSSSGLNWAAVADCESGGNPSIVSSNGLYYGLYQFSLPTWQSVGGSGLPSDASPSEQTMRAQMLYDRAGAGQWPHCGRYF